MLFKGRFWGAYIRSDVCVTKAIRLAYRWKEIYVLFIFYGFQLVRFCFWKTGARFLDRALNVAIAILLLFSTFIWKLLLPYKFLVFLVAFDKGLTPETSAFQIFRNGNSTFINLFDKTKFLYNHLCLFSGPVKSLSSFKSKCKLPDYNIWLRFCAFLFFSLFRIRFTFFAFSRRVREAIHGLYCLYFS